MQRFLLAILTVLLLAAPLTQAHGAPGAREIDSRVLTDGTSNGDYGISIEGTSLADEGGLDILALDVREITLPDSTQGGVVFRTIVQGGDSEVGPHTITLDLKASGQDQSYVLTSSDLATWSSSDFDLVNGPFDVGDGHPKAIEGIVSYATLGVATGTELKDIKVTTHFDGNKADEMPGTWYYQGQAVPADPQEEERALGTFMLAGPADLFTLDANASVVDPGVTGTTVSFTLTSNLESMGQFLTFNVSTGPGVTAKLSASTAILDPGASKTINLNITGFGGGDVRLTASSDLGLSRVASWPLAGGATRGDGGDVQTELMGQGESIKYIFTTPSTFEYHCHPHPWMQGKITIVEDDASDAPAIHIIKILEHDPNDADSYEFSPSELTVQVNDTVVWINEGAQLHNIHGTTGLSGGGHDHGDHDHGDDGDDKGTPGLPLAWLGLALVVLARRRA